MFRSSIVFRAAIAMTLLAAGTAVFALSMIDNCNKKPGYVAITYDDGPNIYTYALVKLLNDNDIKATFFVNGDNFLNLNESEDAQKALHYAFETEHQIASHTWSHQNLDDIVDDEDKFNKEIVLLEQVIQRLLHVRPAYIRPPYGAAEKQKTLEKLESRGYQVIQWSTDTKDYESHNLASEMDKIEKSFKEGGKNTGYIILTHDVYEQTTVELTKSIIQYIKEQNFKTCTVAECVGEPAYH